MAGTINNTNAVKWTTESVSACLIKPLSFDNFLKVVKAAPSVPFCAFCEMYYWHIGTSGCSRQ
jgi:hypothetical protein